MKRIIAGTIMAGFAVPLALGLTSCAQGPISGTVVGRYLEDSGDNKWHPSAPPAGAQAAEWTLLLLDGDGNVHHVEVSEQDFNADQHKDGKFVSVNGTVDTD